MRKYPEIIRMDPKCITMVHVRKEHREIRHLTHKHTHTHTHTHTHGKMKTKGREMQPQVKERQSPPPAGRSKKCSLPEPLEVVQPGQELDFKL